MPDPQFISSFEHPKVASACNYWFVFSGSHLLIEEGDEGAVSVPTGATLADYSATVADAALRTLYLGYLDGEQRINCYGVEVPRETAVSPTASFNNLRQLYTRLPDSLLTLAGRALQIVDWDRTHQFCSRCGTPAEHDSKERVKRCPSCNLPMYPRLAPAIIVQITREGKNGREILLARGPHYPPGWYSVLAGFVEPGESLEECVRREVYEEVGLRVKNIKYFGSQPWPFPHSLMLGFTAEYDSGEFKLQQDEIEDAKWFSKDEMPRIPPRMSISRHLIDDFLEN